MIEHPELPSTQKKCNKRTRVAALDNLNLRSRKILSAVIHDHGCTSYNKLSLGPLYLRCKKETSRLSRVAIRFSTACERPKYLVEGYTRRGSPNTPTPWAQDLRDSSIPEVIPFRNIECGKIMFINNHIHVIMCFISAHSEETMTWMKGSCCQ